MNTMELDPEVKAINELSGLSQEGALDAGAEASKGNAAATTPSSTACDVSTFKQFVIELNLFS
jgi:hypothetical protein